MILYNITDRAYIIKMVTVNWNEYYGSISNNNNPGIKHLYFDKFYMSFQAAKIPWTSYEINVSIIKKDRVMRGF